MMRDDVLRLSDRQMAMLRAAAKLVPVAERDGFLRDVSARLTGPTVGDAALNAAINLTLDRRIVEKEATP